MLCALVALLALLFPSGQVWMASGTAVYPSRPDCLIMLSLRGATPCYARVPQWLLCIPFVLCAFVVIAIHSFPCGSLRIPFRTMVRPSGLHPAPPRPLWTLYKDLAGGNSLLRQGPVKSVSCGCRLSCTSASWPVGLCLFPQTCLGSSVSRSLPTFWTSVSPSVYCLGGALVALLLWWAATPCLVRVPPPCQAFLSVFRSSTACTFSTAVVC